MAPTIYDIGGDTREVRRLLGNSDLLARPRPTRSRGGQLRRDPAGEWDWFYLLDQGLQRWIRRYVMGADGLAPDDVSSLVGFADVDTWAAALVTACQVARDRSAADDWTGEYAADDDLELLGPAELADLLGVTLSAVRQMRHRGRLPAARFELSSMPIWTLGDVREWAAETGRTLDQVAS